MILVLRYIIFHYISLYFIPLYPIAFFPQRFLDKKYDYFNRGMKGLFPGLVWPIVLFVGENIWQMLFFVPSTFNIESEISFIEFIARYSFSGSVVLG